MFLLLNQLLHVDQLIQFYEFLKRDLVPLGATIVHGPEEGGWAPGYFSVLFEDPDGIRLEVIASSLRTHTQTHTHTHRHTHTHK